MAFNGSGVYSPPAASFPAVTGTVIDSTKYNNVVNDIASALTTCLTKDGQTTVTANLPMATYKHTGVGDAAALTDYASANQVVDNTLAYGGASAAGTDTYAFSLPISPGAYVAGNRYQFLADVANTGAATVNVNSLGAKSIILPNGSALYNNAILANMPVDIIYNGTSFILINPHTTGFAGEITSTASELNYSDLTGSLGDAEALKVVTTDASKNINGLNQVTSTTFVGNLTGNVTGNVSGSSGSCTGNAATATNATSATTATTATTASAAPFSGLTGTLARSQQASFTAGDSIITQGAEGSRYSNTAYAKIGQAEVGSGGTLRIIITGRQAAGSGGTARFRIYRNGSAVGTERTTTSTTDVTWSEDIAGWSVGDLVQLYARTTDSFQYAYGSFTIGVDNPIQADAIASSYNV